MSTVLASRNNHHNHHQASYMGEIPNYMNPNPNPNRNPKPKSKKIKHFSNTHNHQVIKKDSAGDAYSFNQRPVENEGFNCGGYVSYKVGSCSRSEINELRKKLVSDLERIRKLNDRIQSGEFSNHPNNLRSVNGKFKKVGAGNKRPLSSFREMSNGDNGIGVMDDEMLKKCKQVLTKLMKHKMSWVFKAPVDVVGLGLHDYHQIIKRPMDLGTVKSNLSKGFYSNVGDFAADVRLVFENAMLYNPRTDDVHGMADQMLRIFEDLFRPIQTKLGKNDSRGSGNGNGNERVGNVNVVSNARVFDMANERVVNVNDMVNDVVNEVNRANEFSAVDELDGSSWDDIQTPERTKKTKGEGKSSGFPVASKQIHSTASNAVNAVIPPVVHSPVRMPSRTPSPMQVTEAVKPSNTSTMTRTVLPKLPKPRAKDPNKREMNMEEKQKLGLGLQSMPPEKMPQLLQIIRKRNDQLAQEGDEIELDIEALDTETLWELDRFVTNWKKFVSKTKRQALMVNGASAVAAPSVSADIDDVPMSEKMDGVKKSKKEAGEEDVDIGDEMPESSFPHVEIEKDDGGGGHGQAATGGGQGNNDNNASSSSSGSSSSSSSGSSSSSDSDSGSSSGSDSDADDAQS